MINRFDGFTKLNEVILGKVNYSLLETIDNKSDKEFMKNVLEEMDRVFVDIEDIFKKFNVKIWRPEVYSYNPNITLGTPFRDVKYVYTSIAPYDNFLAIANTIVEMSSSHSPSASFDYIQYQHIWREKFEQGSRWISMPRSSYNPNKMGKFEDISNFEPYADAPSFLMCGDTIFLTESVIINQIAVDWFKREFPQFKFKTFKGTKGHLDSYFSVVKPGLALSGIPKSELPAEFQNWEILEFIKEDYSNVKFISDVFQDDDYENTTLAVNTFSIDEENIMMMNHIIEKSPQQIKMLEKNKVNVIPLNYDICRWMNQGIACICSAINRNGKLENYF